MYCYTVIIYKDIAENDRESTRWLGTFHSVNTVFEWILNKFTFKRKLWQWMRIIDILIIKFIQMFK